MALDFEHQVLVAAPGHQRLAPAMPPRPTIGKGKRLFDMAFAAAALIALSPVFLVIAVMLRLRERGPVFFAHSRVGQNGQTFRCLKFRTMRENGDEMLARMLAIDPIARREWEEAQKIDRDPRVTRLGAFLRRTSLDELPQFWNVLRGDMSIVGPRPVTRGEAAKYGRHFADYCKVKPGITGAWQVGGRSDTSYEHRVALDVDYVRNGSFAEDLRIVFKTVGVVLAQRGAC
ncbi:sugar transferase [Maritimibacter sp. DP07]|uniref:Sugar transferase n=1 Tax=Maritimibacter harenae TaxID=2606218 RepID=A0A845LYR0_9RHOB|nr:sugar transferase [Maritimibacter harenae]MZR12486.1 sugar transferase [Maritimibacter harenae]